MDNNKEEIMKAMDKVQELIMKDADKMEIVKALSLVTQIATQDLAFICQSAYKVDEDMGTAFLSSSITGVLLFSCDEDTDLAKSRLKVIIEHINKDIDAFDRQAVKK